MSSESIYTSIISVGCRYKGYRIYVKRDRNSMMSSEYSSKPFETLHLSVWGRKKNILKEILEEGKGQHEYFA